MAQRVRQSKRAASSKPAGLPARKTAARRGRPAILTREEILATAKVAFSKGGYANVTLDDLAARLNTGKGTLYYHSNRKVDLLIAISSEAIGDDAGELCGIASFDAAPELRLALAMRVLMRNVLRDQQASKVYFDNESDLPPKIRLKFRRRLRKIQNAFEDIISDGVANGAFRGEPKIVAKHILSTCAWPYRWFSKQGPVSLEAFIDSAISFVLGGVLANPRAERIIADALVSSGPGDHEASAGAGSRRGASKPRTRTPRLSKNRQL